ncbi:MAG: putative toxin-antitoxin system toxin component, PIN family [Luteolibacter sp.]|uniref:putative toxin-antitoxin system toxin component, PIN family n=1 Tax=Luteolibacter sp. TaxID=1962973 RepID=UPI003267BF8A
MIVVLDTNALIQIFGKVTPFAGIRDALRSGKLMLAVSTPILLEYEEVILRYSGPGRWDDVWRFLTLIDLLHGNIRHIGPDYRFHTITGDPDDDAFADCAIVAGADHIITSDHHFDVLTGSGYKPQPITPAEFIQRYPVF